MPFLPAGPPERPPPDLLPIELLLQRQFDLVALDDRNITQQHVTTFVQVPFVPEHSTLFVHCFDDVA